MLMALLPFTAWADELTFKVGTTAVTSVVYTGGDYVTASTPLRVYVGTATDPVDPNTVAWEYNATDDNFGTGTTNVQTIIGAGYYRATVGANPTKVLTVTKANITMSQVPVLNADVTYDGEAHQAIKIAGAATNPAVVGLLTVYYAVSKTGAPAVDATIWATSIDDAKLKVTEAGDYGVYYQVKSDNTANLNNILPTQLVDANSDPVLFKVKKALPILTAAPTAKTGLTYTKANQKLINAGESADGTLEYSLDSENGPWNTAIPQAENYKADGYKVYYRVVPTDGTNYDIYQPYDMVNHNKVYRSVAVSIAKRQVNIRPKYIETYFGKFITTATNVIELDITGLQGADATNPEADGGIFDANNNAKKLTRAFATITTTTTLTNTANAGTYYNAGTYQNALRVSGPTVDPNYIFIYQNNDMKINPAKLTVELTEAPAAVTFGTKAAEKTSWDLAWTEHDKLTVKYQNGDDTFTGAVTDGKENEFLLLTNLDANGAPTDDSKFSGLTISRANESTAVGTYALTLSGATPASGNFVIADDGETVAAGKTFNINAAEITISIINAQKTYGEADPDKLAYEVVESVGAHPAYALNAAQTAAVEAAISRAPGEEAGNYEITIANAVKTDVAFVGYAVTTNNGWFTINKRNLTITAAAQTLYVGNDITKLGKTEKVDYTVEGIKTGDAYTVSLKFGTGDNDQNKATTTNVPKDGNGKLTTQNVYPKGIVISLPAAQWTALTKNYNITLNHGTLTVLDAAAGIVLNGTLDNTEAIAAAALVAGKKDVTIKQRTLKADQWNVLVLPFKISTYDFCKAIGEYAVFNTLKSANGADVKFALNMDDLEANVPFLVKPHATIDTDIQFGDPLVAGDGVTVVDATPTKEVGDAQFVGTYKTITIAAAAEGYSNWAMQDGKFNNIGSDTPNLGALRAYLLLNTTSNARITVEELDGSTTAIAGITADGEAVPAQGWYTINGVKLEGVPTQKGIYINNGKKIVVK